MHKYKYYVRVIHNREMITNKEPISTVHTSVWSEPKLNSCWHPWCISKYSCCSSDQIEELPLNTCAMNNKRGRDVTFTRGDDNNRRHSNENKRFSGSGRGNRQSGERKTGISPVGHAAASSHDENSPDVFTATNFQAG